MATLICCEFSVRSREFARIYCNPFGVHKRHFHRAVTAVAFGGDDVKFSLRERLMTSRALLIPVNVTALNPVSGSLFCEFRIQTVRDSIEDGDSNPYSVDDEPFDEEFGRPYFGLYGVSHDGKLEHIADRKTYSEAVRLAEKLAPGVAFPNSPTVVSRPASRRI